jgi:hypothetical protein
MAYSQKHFHTKVLIGIVFLVLLLFCGEIWHIWKSYEKQRIVVKRNFKLLDLSGKIIHLDEVLTMSCRMAVLTGSSQWQERYNYSKPELDVAITELRELAPDIFTSTKAVWVDSANKKLLAMEAMAFDFITDGHTKEANILLNSAGYLEQKQIYANGIEEISFYVRRQVETTFVSLRWWLLYTLGTAGLILPLLLIILLSILRELRRELF